MKMANNQEIYIEIIAQMATLAANTAVEVILERRHEDIFTRCRSDIKGMRHRHNGCSPVYTYADQVNNSLHTLYIYKPKKDISEAKNIRDRKNIQKENEDVNQTVKSLQFCEMRRHKVENVEEWIKRVRLAANKCEYQEQDR